MADYPTDIEFVDSGCEKVIVLLNKNSGERAAADFVKKQLEKMLTEELVFDLFPVKGKGPVIEEAKEFIVKQKPDLIIVGGGDGTVSLALDITDALRKDGRIGSLECPVAILPMGTGNDLSRSLGFGGGYAKAAIDPEKKFKTLIGKLKNAIPCHVDRFKVDVYKVGPAGSAGFPTDGRGEGDMDNADKPVYSHNFINYFSVGFDADVAEKFGDFRNQNPKACSNRTMNKMWYGAFGCKAMVSSSSFPKKRVQLTVDGKEVKIPSGAKSVIVLNVLTFSGGVKLWSDSKEAFGPQLLDDKKAEVLSLNGVWHMIGAGTKTRTATKVSQGTTIELRLPADYTMQYDGEPLNAVGEHEEDILIKIQHVSQSLASRLPDGVVQISSKPIPLCAEECSPNYEQL
ncbi:Diacylglycerol kinase catalytic domain/Diacylglycerol kinase accessory domain containing protein, putative [Angomonas deanei]|uniref:Diacylglycerol kinase n=1 Tax=Angomonas deanei TaxID=59799 RepID=A0A7G2CK46_9TRYP|nr:Diacylglycerol kinase catalytic domain/Diacylglycerol kinase accessory domain containing protein, putative [Angomonas deanei]